MHMKRSTRTSLFVLFVALFLVVAPLIIGYSQGYRIDWQNKTLVQTGALFLEPRPAPVGLFLNGKLEKKSSFVFQNIFVGNLIPKNYNIEIKKDGYSSWEKTLSVIPKLVTEAKNVILFPEASPSSIGIAYAGVKNFFASPSGKILAFVKNNPVPSLALYSLEKQTKMLSFSAPPEFIKYEIGDMQWNESANRLIFSLQKNTQKRWVSVNTDGNTLKSMDISQEIETLNDFKNYTKKLYRPTIERLKWSSRSLNEVFFIIKDNYGEHMLFSYALNNKKLSAPLAYDVLEYFQKDNEVFYISSALGNINQLNLDTGQIRQLSYSQISNPQKNGPVEFISGVDESYIAISSDGQLYSFNKETDALEKISDIDHASATDNNEKILSINKSNLGVYWLKDVRTQPFHDSGDFETVYISNKFIRDAVWFSKNNEYIIFSSEDTIKIAELDGRDKRNVHLLAQKPAEKLFYDKRGETLYFLSDNTAYSLSLK